jgi:hypothetical protein
MYQGAANEKGTRKQGQPNIRRFDFDFDTPGVAVRRFTTLALLLDEWRDMVHGGLDVSALVSLPRGEHWAFARPLLRVLLHGGRADSQHCRLDVFLPSICRSLFLHSPRAEVCFWAVNGAVIIVLGVEYFARWKRTA